ncbi:MAG: hypothetical protein D6753_04535 [Planctomycetota bacterium]|nr:MAG: hypothetical protein D6753_04535 [Planctomycetota bacterium]
MASELFTHGISKLVSGGQTGVDRAALDVALDLGIDHGGWCPQGRIAEDGRLDARYLLTEMDSPDYAARTEQNVIDSDATLILYRRRMQGGTLLTYRIANRRKKPVLRVRIDGDVSIPQIASWLHQHSIAILNVAGPRGSSHPRIYHDAYRILSELFRTECILCDG